MKSITEKYTPTQRADILAGLKGGLKHLAKSMDRETDKLDTFICLAIGHAFDSDEIAARESAAAKEYIQRGIKGFDTLSCFLEHAYGIEIETHRESISKPMQKIRKNLLKILIAAFEEAQGD